MELKNAENKRVIEICKGGALVWEMPSCEAVIGSSIQNEVKVTVFPKGSKVTFKIIGFDYDTFEEKVLYEETKKPKGNFCEFVRPGEFSKEKDFAIEVSCDGYKEYSNTGKFM